MSSLGLKLTVLLCFSCTVLCNPDSSQVEWKKAGEAITIKCSTSEKDKEYLTLVKGLNEEVQVIYMDFSSKEKIITKEYQDRLQASAEVCNVDILIKNLTSDDTGPYWCVYKKFDTQTGKRILTRGKGSVLLVVTANGNQVNQVCKSKQDDLVLVTVVISAIVLLSLILGALIWMFFKTKSLRTTVKPRRVTTNDVYEDMRGTLRR